LLGLAPLEKSLEEVHQYSIPADAIQQDRSVLLSSYESTSLAHGREDVEHNSNNIEAVLSKL
jgi:hypothetical protein